MDDCTIYKNLTEEKLNDRMQRLPIQPPIWFKLKQHQQACFLLGIDKRRVYFANDTGCLAGNTLLETNEGTVRIDVLERRGNPIKVWSKTINGLQIVDASCPFKKGPTSLFKVDFESGRSITVTNRHRFLGKEDWISCGVLSVGECLPIFDVYHPQSILESFDVVSKITYAGEDFYYDLHVPVHENYIAHGFCHHNTGKSLLSIALIKYFRKLKTIKCALVLTPTKISKYEWAREIEKHSPKTKYCVLAGSSVQKWQSLVDDEYDLVVASYMGLVRMLCDLVPPKGKKKKNHLEPDKKKVKMLLSIFDGLILDEATFVKTYGTLPFRICRQISKQANFVFALSGTPFGSDPTDLWAQMFLVDKGDTLGPTLGLFRTAFFNEYLNGFGIEYKFKETMHGKLHAMLRNRMIRYKAKQADLPKLVEIVKEVRLPEACWMYRDRAKAAIESAHGSYRDMQNAFLRLRQISSGWLGYYDDDVGSKAQFQFTPNPKLELLVSIIESIDPQYKIIVFYEFNYSASMIEQELKKLKIGFTRIWGGTKDHAEVLKKFDSDPQCRILLLQNSAGYGPNLQVAKFGLYFESPVSPIVRTQTRRRFERQHSTHDVVFQYDLVSVGTYDSKILFALKAGQDLFKSIIDGKQALGVSAKAVDAPVEAKAP